MRILILSLLLCCATGAGAQRNLEPKSLAAGETRVALVIGNAAYQNGPLRNPVNDARAMAERLQRLGFHVIRRENMKAKDIGPALREFRSRLTAGAVALFFYAGHGLQVKGVNYLPGVDADIEAEEDVYTQALDVAKVIELMEEAKTRVNLVFLDACRNNPFSRRFRSASTGLARIQASGTLISFATRPGSVAADGDGKNGLYTEHLLKHMDEPGVPVEQMLKRVGGSVKLASKGRQEPWTEGLIDGDFFFRGGAQFAAAPASSPAPAPAPEPARVDPLTIELSFWDSIKASSNPDDFKAYLQQYPNGQFSSLARNRAVPPPKPAEPPPLQVSSVSPSTGTREGCIATVRAGYKLSLADKEAGVRQMHNALESCGGSLDDVWRFRTHTNLGATYALLKRWDAAMQQFRNALRYSHAAGEQLAVVYEGMAYVVTEKSPTNTRDAEGQAYLAKVRELCPKCYPNPPYSNSGPLQLWVLDMD